MPAKHSARSMQPRCDTADFASSSRSVNDSDNLCCLSILLKSFPLFAVILASLWGNIEKVLLSLRGSAFV